MEKKKRKNEGDKERDKVIRTEQQEINSRWRPMVWFGRDGRLVGEESADQSGKVKGRQITSNYSVTS